MLCSGHVNHSCLTTLTLAALISSWDSGSIRAADRNGTPLAPTATENARHAQAHPECTCRAAGASHPIGAQICLTGGQLFRCSMDQNVTSWKPVGTACPQS